ncbi:hypothetical protein BKA65DRAFT_545750 [Rhexocercosporidium sp. MPI-PUGE-AT-0058]|nr:hypothetical protein BKA65DRAFT_545750 [Rhexocercosporidium sp. MPI-PUGE-AT-0058]
MIVVTNCVRDLIQEAPDSPIGGQLAASMGDRVVGTMAIRGKDSTVPPKAKRPLKSRSNYSESLPDPFFRGKQSSMSPEPFAALENAAPGPRAGTPQSEASMTMVTAPDTPIFGRRNEYSDMSDIAFDGSPGSLTEIKDFAVVTKVTESTKELEVDMCPDCDSPTAQPDSNGLSLPSSGAPVSAVPSSGISPSSAPASDLPAPALSPSEISAASVPAASLPSRTVPAFGISTLDALPLSGLSQPGGDGLCIPGSNLSRGLAVPADITGKLDPPGTPVPSKKRMALGKGKKKGQQVVRRGRKLILRKPVLALVVGRQLAGPTSTALKLISKGTPVDPTAFKDAAVPGVVPQPVPLPA